MRTIETTVYTYDELSEEAQERARDWYREGAEFIFDHCYDDFERVAEILGVEFRTRDVPLHGGGTRKEPCIWFSGFYNQGDGASFEGWYSYAKGSCKAAREYAPKDKELHRIADELAEIQKRNFYGLQATIGSHGLRYSHSGNMAVTVDYSHDEWRSPEPKDDDAIREALRSLADWFYSQLEKEYEYQQSDENVADTIRVNEYEFMADGRIA